MSVGFPSAVFDDLDKARTWIARYKLVGTLTLEPINISATSTWLANIWSHTRCPNGILSESNPACGLEQVETTGC